jgi:hypothetical protein
MVTEVNKDRNRITLSRSGVAEMLEKEELSHYMDKIQKNDQSSESLGSFGELLRAAMAKKK